MPPTHPVSVFACQPMKKIQDSYFHKAKREGFAARSVYKLEQIDRKRKLLRRGMRVLDLGTSPGSWLQYAARQVGAQGHVLGVDLQEPRGGLPAHARILQADVFDIPAHSLLQGGAPFDVVLSDMAPRTTGVPSADAARSEELARRALALSAELLRPGGSLLVKVFQGGGLPALRKTFAAHFAKVTLEKPKASRSESVEIFLLGTGKKEGPAA
ncbi:MAG: RlmE family RNA methyltransferase [SAR324 cluster bacterium]|nr:RlmE family RNA methyltransferase [SAR324 cluster bacterium]